MRTTIRCKKKTFLKAELKRSVLLLESAYSTLAHAIQNKQTVSPASEWFVDNFHIIESQYLEINQNLTRHYFFGLPELMHGELKGFPRVYVIALSIVAHTDSRLDQQTLQRYLTAFQKVTPLEMSEIWALIITIRIILVQHLTARSQRLINARQSRIRADNLAEKLLSYTVQEQLTTKNVTTFMAREMSDNDHFNRPFLVQLVQRLRDQDIDLSLVLEWIEAKLFKQSLTIDKLIQQELHQQAAGQVAIGNIIASMRLASTLDWREFFESVNLVDPILGQDPAGIYFQMDFATRDKYRHTIDQIAKRSQWTETEIAQKAIDRGEHVGQYLIGNKKQLFLQECGYRPHWKEYIQNFVYRYPTLIYLGSAFTLTSLLLVFSFYFYYAFSITNTFFIDILFAILAFFPASEMAISIHNHFITHWLKPHFLPRMETEHGIPTNDKTMIVIPTLFSKDDVVTELVERLEIHFLSTRDPHFIYALLGDFTDGIAEHMPQDEKILEIAHIKIGELNNRYCKDSLPLFHLFHRKRIWNQSEGAWIGWERKRGKLHELNRLLRGATDTSFIVASAPQEICKQIKYIITLDSDTQLPKDAAKKLVGIILHPLNQPLISQKLQRVIQGYGILQPRISITTSSASNSFFAKISSGNIGIDPYTTAVSDVYQDLFGEGSFSGKGLYVVDAFEAVMNNRVPENRVLSHDLFEGNYARCALVSNVELFDEYPADYDTFSKRAHRWTRGDWQIGTWILPLVRNGQGKRVKNELSIIARWKIFDNLRRSLVPLATMIWLLMAWTCLPGPSIFWTALIIMTYLFPVYSTLLTGNWMVKGSVTIHEHILEALREAKIKINQILLTISFLPQQAWTQTDAIVRVFYRLNISKRKLLEWTSFAQLASEKKETIDLADYLCSGTLTALIATCFVFWLRPGEFYVAFPFLLIWIINPWIKYWLNKQPKLLFIPLSEEDQIQFRIYARRTWHFFEQFVTEKDNWLAPDNYQEDPTPVVAHRTSPTNIGLQLLSSISAYDQGYLGRLQLIEQLEKTFFTLSKMETLNGHFFNWYDTTNLHPLKPRYISTVDSGNLAGHLIVVKQFLLELGNTNRSFLQQQKGIEDTLKLLLLEINLYTNKLMDNNISIKILIRSVQDSLNKLQQQQIQHKEDWQTLLRFCS